jgi:hypothetical protein
MPDVASVPLKLIPTGWLYQPFESGPRSGEALVMVGAVVSRLTSITGVLYEPPVLYWILHWNDSPVVSDVTVNTPQPGVPVIDGSGATKNATVTFDVYQPGEHPPPLQDQVTGSALAAGTKTSIGAQTSASARK